MVFGKHLDGRWSRPQQLLEVYGVPPTGSGLPYVQFGVGLPERRGQEVFGPALFEVGQDRQDLAGVEMNQQVPAKNQVHGRQSVRHGAHNPKGDVGELALDLLDDVRYDVRSHVPRDAIKQQGHERAVPTWDVQKGLDVVGLDDPGDYLADMVRFADSCPIPRPNLGVPCTASENIDECLPFVVHRVIIFLVYPQYIHFFVLGGA